MYVKGGNKDRKVSWDHVRKTLNSVEFEVGQNSVGSY